MPCQICGKYSSFYPTCRKCRIKVDNGEYTKCQKCGTLKDNNLPLCKHCYYEEHPQGSKKIESAPSTALSEERNFRQKYPANIRATDGHMVRSKSEKIIDDYLYNNEILHIYEKRLPIEENVVSDFYLKKYDAYIEFWGLEDKKYLERMRFKKEIYEREGYRLIDMTDKEVYDIDTFLPLELTRMNNKIEKRH